MIKRILVCVKLVPTADTAEIDGQFRLKRDSVNLQLNIADLSALEVALRLKIKVPDLEISVISMGPIKTKQTLQELYALGIDCVTLLSDTSLVGADSYATANALSHAIKYLGEFDCILCGRRAIDAETGQVAGQLAAAFDIPVITNIQELNINDEGFLCERRLENGTAQISVASPCVLSICEYSYRLRLPSIMGKRRAREKSVNVINTNVIGLTAEECGIKGSKTKVVNVNSKALGLRKCNYLQPKGLAEKIGEVLL